MLTTADVEQKTFSTALRGYDLDEVDDFLDEIVATIRELTEQLEEARSAAAAGPVDVTPTPTPEPVPTIEADAAQVVEAPQPEIDESAIGRALVTAQEAADRLLEHARSEANQIVEVAKSEADEWSAEREAKRREAEAEMSRLTTRVASIRSELSILAGEVAERLDEMDSVIGTGSNAAMWPKNADVIEGGAELAALSEEIDTDYPDGESADESVPDISDNGSEATDHLDAMLSDVVNDLRLPGGEDHEESEQEGETSDGQGDAESWDEGHEEDE